MLAWLLYRSPETKHHSFVWWLESSLVVLWKTNGCATDSFSKALFVCLFKFFFASTFMPVLASPWWTESPKCGNKNGHSMAWAAPEPQRLHRSYSLPSVQSHYAWELFTSMSGSSALDSDAQITRGCAWETDLGLTPAKHGSWCNIWSNCYYYFTFKHWLFNEEHDIIRTKLFTMSFQNET